MIVRYTCGYGRYKISGDISKIFEDGHFPESLFKKIKLWADTEENWNLQDLNRGRSRSDEAQARAIRRSGASLPTIPTVDFREILQLNSQGKLPIDFDQFIEKSEREIRKAEQESLALIRRMDNSAISCVSAASPEYVGSYEQELAEVVKKHRLKISERAGFGTCLVKDPSKTLGFEGGSWIDDFIRNPLPDCEPFDFNS